MKQYKTYEELWDHSEVTFPDDEETQIEITHHETVGQINDMLIGLLDIMRKEKE